MKNLIIIFFVLLIFSCKNRANEENVNDIISLMIDKRAFPLPPPPAINDTITTVINKRVRDSLLQVKLKVALYPTLYDFSSDEIKAIIPKQYKGIIEMKGINSKKIKLDKLLFTEKGHEIMLADTTQIKKSRDFENFDLLFWFSNFYYSKDKEKVFFGLGISRSKLDSNGVLYILKKENSKWQIEYSEVSDLW